MSTQIYTSFNSAAGLGVNAMVEIRNASDGIVNRARSNAGVREDKPGCYTFFGSVADNSDGVYSAYWDKNDGSDALMELIGGVRIVTTEVPGSSSGGVSTVFGPPGTVVVVE